MYLIDQGDRVAVLAVDPSSTRTGGSILGDKTRMAKLAVHPDAYISAPRRRQERLGVAKATRETIDNNPVTEQQATPAALTA